MAVADKRKIILVPSLRRGNELICGFMTHAGYSMGDQEKVWLGKMSEVTFKSICTDGGRLTETGLGPHKIIIKMRFKK
jgi:hypothetical protein